MNFIICSNYFDPVLDELVSVPAVEFEFVIEVVLLTIGRVVFEFEVEPAVEFDWENTDAADIDAKNMVLNIVTDNTIPRLKLCFLLTIEII